MKYKADRQEFTYSHQMPMQGPAASLQYHI